MDFLTRIAVLSIAALSLGQQARLDPRATAAALHAERNRQISEAVKAGRTADFARIDKELVEKAKAKLEGVDPAKIVAKTGLDWAALFTLAERHREARDLISRYLSLDLPPIQKFSAQLEFCNACYKLDDGAALYDMLMKVEPPNAANATWLGSITGGTYHHWIRNARGADGALKAVQRVKGFLNKGPYKTLQEAKDTGWARRQIADCEAVYLAELGRRDEAITVLDEALTNLPKDTYRLSELGLSRKRIEMLDRPAPALPPGKSHGEFKGLDAYRGRVVLIEFTAHWCHACHEALPSVRELAKVLKGRPFDVLSVTTYYGHFLAERSKERDMPRETEFAKMPALMEKLGIAWPMVYCERDTMNSWGVSGIPEFIVLDKSGKVQMLDLGFSKEKFGRIREKIDGLLRR